MNTVALRWHHMAGHARPLPTEVPKNIDRPTHFALGFRERLPFLARHLRAQLIELPLQNIGSLKENRPTIRRGHGRPRGERGLSGLSGTRHIGRGALTK